MSENPLRSILPVPGSGSTSEPGNSGSGQMGLESGAVAAKSRRTRQPKPAPTLDQLQQRFLKRAQATKATQESPYAILEAAMTKILLMSCANVQPKGGES